MEKQAKTYLLLGLFILGIISAFLAYRAFASPLSSRRIAIVMHDANLLKTERASEPLYLHSSIQLPAECMLRDVPGLGITAASKAITFHLSGHKNDEDPDFKKYVIKQRRLLLTSVEAPKIDEEGVAKIAGRDAYVMTYHFASGMNGKPIKAREVYVNGPDLMFFDIYFACDEADWPSKADAIDSSISTFQIDPS